MFRGALALLVLPGALAGVLRVQVPGASTCTDGITETDVRAGGRAILLSLSGDTWRNADFDKYRGDVVAGLRSFSGEPAGFAVKRASILPLDAVVVDMRRNDFTVMALLLEADETYNIIKDEKVFVDVPGNVTVSGARPTTPDNKQSFFVICAAQSVLKVPATIYEQELRDGGVELSIFLTSGEEFVQRKPSAILDLIRNFNSSLRVVSGENYNFYVRRNMLLVSSGFEIIAPAYDQLNIRLSPDPLYNFYEPFEIVNITLPTSLMVSGFEPTPRSSLGFVVQNSAGQVWIDGSASGQPEITENMIREGGSTLTMVLKHDKWAITGTDPNVEGKQLWIESFNSQDGPTGIWDSKRSTILKTESFTLINPAPVSQRQRLLITFQPEPSFLLLTGTQQEIVRFSVPSRIVQSGLVPRGAEAGSGPAIFELTIKAMGSVTQDQAGSQVPVDSSDIRGETSGLKKISVKLEKDVWRQDTCASEVRNGFNSSLSSTAGPYAFLAKRDRIIGSNAIFTPCLNGGTCLMELHLQSDATYTLAPADEQKPPQPEVITFRVPARCVQLNIQPAGFISFPIAVHPSEVRFNTFSPGSTAEDPGTTTIYNNRGFQLELYYNSDWNTFRMVQSIDCAVATDVANSIASQPMVENCKCSVAGCCRTLDAATYPNGFKLLFKPPPNLAPGADWTTVGSWSLCAFLSNRGVYARVGNPFTIEKDPLQNNAPTAFDLAGEIDAQIVVIGALFALCMVFGIAFVVREIVVSSKEDQEQSQRNYDKQALGMQNLVSAYTGFGAMAHDAESRRQTLAQHNLQGGFAAFDGGQRLQLLDDDELPDIGKGVAKFAYSEFGESDPRVERLQNMKGMAYHEQLVAQKRRLQDVGMIDSEDEEEEEEEDEEYEEDEEMPEEEDHDDPFMRAGQGGHWFQGAAAGGGGGGVTAPTEEDDRRADLYGSDSDDGRPTGAAPPAPPQSYQFPSSPIDAAGAAPPPQLTVTGGEDS